MEGTVTTSVLQELLTIFGNGGFVMPPLALMAVLLWVGIGFRALTLRRGTADPVRLVVQNIRKDSRAYAETEGYITQAAQIAVETEGRVHGDLRKILDEELFLLDEQLNRWRTLVRTIVVVAPLAGLLGTVSGMIEMFESLGNQTFFSQTGGVANGISQALLTTQFGLVIAIPGMIVGRLTDRREERMREDIEQIKELVITHEKEKAS